MIRVYVFCEGQTEETMVRDVLGPYLAQQAVYLTPIVARTSSKQKGGVVSYDKVKNQIIKLCKQAKNAYVTTLIDYYGLPSDFPQLKQLKSQIQADAQTNILKLEQAFAKDIDQHNFIANFMLHEFEAWLFSDLDKFSNEFDDSSKIEQLKAVRAEFATPEHINNNQQTAPSKRILAIIPNYKKTLHGPKIADAIGIATLAQQCPHFGQWLSRLGKL